jgi:hypothetical protein
LNIFRVIISAGGVFKELLRFLWRKKMWWLIPLIILEVIIALLILLGATTGIGPFIYPVF